MIGWIIGLVMTLTRRMRLMQKLIVQPEIVETIVLEND